MSNQTLFPHESLEGSTPFIEGVGNEILLAVFAVILLTPVITYVVYRLFRSDINEQGGNEGDQNLDPDNEQVPRLTFNNGACPICLSETIRLPCQTNCGHSYCGMCLYNLLTHYERDFFDSDNAMYCPLCRQKVTLIYVSFNRNQQLEEPERSQMERVTQFVRYYNRTFSGHPRSLMDQITDLPITLRHLWNDFFTLGGFMRIRLRVQVCMYFISAMLYFFVPHDVVPETVFGLFGLVDDILVMFLVIIYLAVIYRNAVVNDDVNDIGLGDAN